GDRHRARGMRLKPLGKQLRQRLRALAEKAKAVLGIGADRRACRERPVERGDFLRRRGERYQRIQKALALLAQRVEPRLVAEVGEDQLAVQAAVAGAESPLRSEKLAQLAVEGDARREQRAQPLDQREGDAALVVETVQRRFLVDGGLAHFRDNAIFASAL